MFEGLIVLPVVSIGRELFPMCVPRPSLLLNSGAKAGVDAHSTPTTFSAKCQNNTPDEYQVRSPNHNSGRFEAKSTTVKRLVGL